jgi:hypothetical protein
VWRMAVVRAPPGPTTFRFEQPIPVMAYLIALCCGNLEGQGSYGGTETLSWLGQATPIRNQ